MTDVVVIGSRDALTGALAAALGRVPGLGRIATRTDTGEAALAEDAVVVYTGRETASGLPDPERAARLFDEGAQRRIRQLVLLSSAAIHEPNGHHPGHVDETRVKPPRNGNRLPCLWTELEALAATRLVERGVTVTTLRPTAVPVAGGRDYFSRLLGGKLAVTVAGHDPSLQVLSVEDLARAVSFAIESGRSGVFHVAPDGVIPLRKALALAGRRRLPLPHWVQRLGRRTLGPVTGAASLDEVQYARYSWSVSGRRIADDLRFRPRHSSADAILALAGTNGRPRDPRGVAERSDPAYDPFGMDKRYIAAFGRTLFRFLHDVWWRVEIKDLAHVPRQGGAILAGMHRGWMPWDGVMMLHLLAREIDRYPRFLIHPSLLRFPFLFNYMTKLGGIVACQENADWTLGRGHLLGLFPEGIHGAFSMYRDAYKLGRFGRDEFVKMALRHRVPIVPYVTVGSAEIYPIVGRIDWAWFRRFTEWPFLPITANGPFVPLPSKWHTWFLEPLNVHERYGPEAAADRKVVRAISQEVRERMAAAVETMLARRRSIFWGSVFETDAAREDAA